MPDANLPALAITPTYLESLRAAVPELPWECVARLTSTYGLERRDVETLISLDEYGGAGVTYFESAAGNNGALGKKISNW